MSGYYDILGVWIDDAPQSYYTNAYPTYTYVDTSPPPSRTFDDYLYDQRYGLQ